MDELSPSSTTSIPFSLPDCVAPHPHHPNILAVGCYQFEASAQVEQPSRTGALYLLTTPLSGHSEPVLHCAGDRTVRLFSWPCLPPHGPPQQVSEVDVIGSADADGASNRNTALVLKLFCDNGASCNTSSTVDPPSARILASSAGGWITSLSFRDLTAGSACCDFVFRGHSDHAWCVCALDDGVAGHCIASGGDDCYARVFDARTSRTVPAEDGGVRLKAPVVAFEHPAGVTCIANVPHSSAGLLTSCYDGIVRFWDVRQPSMPVISGLWDGHSLPSAIDDVGDVGAWTLSPISLPTSVLSPEQCSYWAVSGMRGGAAVIKLNTNLLSIDAVAKLHHCVDPTSRRCPRGPTGTSPAPLVYVAEAVRIAGERAGANSCHVVVSSYYDASISLFDVALSD